MTIALTVLGAVAVALRCLTRAVGKLRFGADDWWALIAFSSFMIEQSICLYGMSTALPVKLAQLMSV